MKTLFYVCIVFLTGLFLIKKPQQYNSPQLPKHTLHSDYVEPPVSSEIDSIIALTEKNIEYFKRIK